MRSLRIRLLGSNSAKLAKIPQNLKLNYRFYCVICKIVVYLRCEIISRRNEVNT